MNKILIIGHPSSGVAEVETLLRERGMRAPQPARREGWTASEIIERLRLAHQLPHLGSASEEADLVPAVIHPIWNELTLDLLAGNVGREPWGFADPNLVFFLRHWHQLVEDALFVFVFGPPSDALRGTPLIAEGPATCKRLDNWAAYNGAMLRFHLRHRDRSILIHEAHARGDAETLLEIMNQRLSTPLGKTSREAKPISATASCRAFHEELRLAAGEAADSDGTCKLDGYPATDFLFERMLEEKPGYPLLYAEMQSAADLPLDETVAVEMNPGPWAAWADERQLSMRLLEKFRALTEAHGKAELRNRLIFLQLAQLREEHERLQIDFQHLAFSRENPPPPTGAAEMVKQELSYRLGHCLVKRSHNPLALLVMPLLLVREAWRFHAEQHARGKRPPIQTYDDAHLAKPVKQQLSYRLGDAIVRNCRTPVGWCVLPFALIRQTTAYRRSRKQKK